MKVLVSACLLGRNCKYNGGNNLSQRILALADQAQLVPVCPEECLGVPRVPMELREGRLVNRDGVSVDEAMRHSVAGLMEKIKDEDIAFAVLKSRSPTCGVKQIYDGSFTGKLVDGMGILAEALQKAGIPVIDCEEDTLWR